jgi:hypothetical protein
MYQTISVSVASGGPERGSPLDATLVRMSSGRAASASKHDEESSVLARGAAGVHDGAELSRVAIQERGRVEPKAGKNRRTVHLILTGRHTRQHALTLKHEPSTLSLTRSRSRPMHVCAN